MRLQLFEADLLDDLGERLLELDPLLELDGSLLVLGLLSLLLLGAEHAFEEDASFGLVEAESDRTGVEVAGQSSALLLSESLCLGVGAA